MKGHETNEGFLPIMDITLSDLPSKGLPYPDDLKISYRTYTWGDVQQVSTSIRNSYHDYLRFALLGVKAISSSPFSVLDLTLSDAIYICMLRKINSMGGLKIELEFPCQNPKCEHTIKKVFTQNDIEFLDIKASALPASVTLSNEKTYTFMPLTVGKFFDLIEGKLIVANKKKEELLKDKIALLSAMVVNHKFQDVYSDFIKITDMYDAEDIEEIDKLLHSDIKPLKTKCDKCSTEQYIVLEGKEHLLKPFRDGERNNRRRVQFGNESKSITVGDEVSGI